MVLRIEGHTRSAYLTVSTLCSSTKSMKWLKRTWWTTFRGRRGWWRAWEHRSRNRDRWCPGWTGSGLGTRDPRRSSWATWNSRSRPVCWHWSWFGRRNGCSSPRSGGRSCVGWSPSACPPHFRFVGCGNIRWLTSGPPFQVKWITSTDALSSSAMISGWKLECEWNCIKIGFGK